MNNLVTLLTLSREWSIVLSVLISMGSIVVFAVVAYLVFYLFAYKMLRTRSDWGKRAFFLILVSLIGLAVRFVCVLSAGVHSFQDYLTYSVQTIYNTIGVFSFEGQENAGLYDFLYFYATLWVAVTYVVVIFTGFNYSLQSKIALRLPKSKDTEFYIFTKVTDESFALAESIEKYHKEVFKVPFKIIFASDEIDTFDPKNELHKKIRSSGFYFISIEKKASDKEKKPMIDSLGISFKRVSKVHIFAMERDESNRGNEIRNSDIIFDDVSCMIRKYKNRLISEEFVRDNYIQYFIYVNNEVNSEFFEEMLKDLMPKDSMNSGAYNLYSLFFRIKGFSEAQLCGLSLLMKRQDIEVERILESKKLNYAKDDTHRALVIGFGPNGQASLKNLFLDSATICSNSVANQKFEAHILDINIETISGIFELNHPSIIFRHGKEFLKPDKYEINKEDLEAAYLEIFKEDSKKIFEDMHFPVYNFYNINCKGEGVLEKITEECKRGFFNSVIISMGNDEANIELANALLKNLRQFVYSLPEYHRDLIHLDIYINLREENAEKRLYWNSELEKSVHPGINVIPYGDYGHMFTYENIISDKEWFAANKLYDVLSGTLSGDYKFEGRELILNFKEYGKNEQKVRELVIHESRSSKFIYMPSNYNRESSSYAYHFYRYYQAYFDAFEGSEKDKQEIYDYLASVEHVRWNRFVIISGFKYILSFNSTHGDEYIAKNQYYSAAKNARKNYSKRYVKLHTDIVPTYMLSESTFAYDYMNVMSARCQEK